VSQTLGAPRRLWDTKAPPTSALRDYGLASQARETDGDGAPIFTPEFPKADPYLFGERTPAFALRDYGLASQSARDGRRKRCENQRLV